MPYVDAAIAAGKPVAEIVRLERDAIAAARARMSRARAEVARQHSDIRWRGNWRDVLAALVTIGKSGYVYASQDTIAAVADVHVRTVGRWLNRFKSAGIIVATGYIVTGQQFRLWRGADGAVRAKRQFELRPVVYRIANDYAGLCRALSNCLTNAKSYVLSLVAPRRYISTLSVQSSPVVFAQDQTQVRISWWGSQNRHDRTIADAALAGGMVDGQRMAST